MCEDLARFVGTRPGEIRRKCTTVVREGREEAEWSTVDISECGLSMTALQLCEISLNMVTNIITFSIDHIQWEVHYHHKGKFKLTMASIVAQSSLWFK